LLDLWAVEVFAARWCDPELVRRMEAAGTLTEWKDVELKSMEVSPRVVGNEVEAGRSEVAGGDTRLAVADEVARAEFAAAPWWLWWNVLSLDAPMVAVAWALVFAECAEVALPGAEIAVLGLVVWLIYTVDRLLDGRTSLMQGGAGAFGSPLMQRHAFHRVHARAIAWVAAGVGASTSVLVFTQIGAQILKLAVPLGLVLVLYMALVHLGRGRILVRLLKEVAVGGIFAAGVALPAWSRLGARRWEFLVLAALFAAVCTLNCVAIEEWERGRDRNLSVAGLRQSAMVGFGLGSGKFAAMLAVCATLLAPVVRLRGEFSAIGAAIAVSAVLILLLDLMRERISADVLRVLVDVALLAPALVVLVMR
jgi:hypothetical protein